MSMDAWSASERLRAAASATAAPCVAPTESTAFSMLKESLTAAAALAATSAASLMAMSTFMTLVWTRFAWAISSRALLAMLQLTTARS